MSIEKIAMVKTAEVGGVVAALVDADYIKVADEDSFATLIGEVSERTGDDYTLESIVQKTAEVIKEAIELDAEEIDVPTEPVAKEGPKAGEEVAKENMKVNDDTDGGMAASDPDKIAELQEQLETVSKQISDLTKSAE